MLRFICPHCRTGLNISEKYLGLRGKCNKCGGRIALIGRADSSTPQMASMVTDEVAEETGHAEKAATTKQLDFLRKLGVPEDRLEGLSLKKASDLIDYLRERERDQEAPTEKQLQYLAKLGAPEKQVAALRSKAAASQLIEAMHLLPTREQLDALKELGASGAQIAALKRRAHATALIEELQKA